MRIAFIVTGFPRLSQTFLDMQVAELLKRGVEVRIFATTRVEGEPVHPFVTETGMLEHVTYRGRPHPNRLRRLAQALKHVLKQKFKRWPGLLATHNPFKYGMQGLSGTPVMRFDESLANGEFDVVHCHFGTVAQPIATLAAARLVKSPILTTFYGYDASAYLDQNGPDVYRHVFGQSEKLLVLSQAMGDRLIESGAAPDSLVIHHLGVDTSSFTYLPRSARDDGSCRLIIVCRLVEKKGIAQTLEALAIARRLNDRLSFTVIGDGPLLAELIALRDSLGLGEVVAFEGRQTQDQVMTSLAEHDVFLSPSVTAADGDKEGTPTAIIEASAAGMPIISTFHAGIPEVVIDGESGFLVPERDIEALADAIVRMAASAERWSEMGQRGRSHIEAEFDAGRQAERLIEIYRRTSAKR